MIAPPRTIELLLASFGADADFRDVVIGDLAEEFAHRVDSEGAGAARRWYYREAMRATPHLAHSSLRRLGVRGLWHRLGIVFSAYTIMLVAATVPLAMANAAAKSLGAPIPTWHLAGNVGISILMIFGVVAVDLAMATFGGYVAAYLDAETPLLSAGMLGAVWLTMALAGNAVVQAVFHPRAPAWPVPLWYRSIAIVAIMIGTAAGGVLRVRARRRVQDEDLAGAGA